MLVAQQMAQSENGLQFASPAQSDVTAVSVHAELAPFMASFSRHVWQA
jgi:hypothetical protein